MSGKIFRDGFDNALLRCEAWIAPLRRDDVSLERTTPQDLGPARGGGGR